MQFGVAWLMGARFDIAWHQIRQGFFRPPPVGPATEEVVSRYDHGEL